MYSIGVHVNSYVLTMYSIEYTCTHYVHLLYTRCTHCSKTAHRKPAEILSVGIACSFIPFHPHEAYNDPYRRGQIETTDHIPEHYEYLSDCIHHSSPTFCPQSGQKTLSVW